MHVNFTISITLAAIFKRVLENARSSDNAVCHTKLCLTPSKRRMNGRTNKRQESNLAHFSLKMWYLAANIWMVLLTINWPHFVYLLFDPRFLYVPLIFFTKHRGSSPHRMDAPDRHNGRTKETRLFVRLSVRLLDGIWRSYYVLSVVQSRS